jgi:hypothetical protein
MLIYPAIDLVGGRCVRLSQGLFEDATVYSADPPMRSSDLPMRARPGPMSSTSTGRASGGRCSTT